MSSRSTTPPGTLLLALAASLLACSDPPPSRPAPTRSIPIELPAPTNASDLAYLIVSLDSAGEIDLVGRNAELADIGPLVRTLAGPVPPDRFRVVIRAAHDTPHERVVAVIDALREAGVERYSFELEPAPTPDRPLPAPMAVCVESGDGTLLAREAVPGRAGVHRAGSDFDPAFLNWRIESVGCVAYPMASGPMAVCGDRTTPAPVVTRRLCAR